MEMEEIVKRWFDSKEDILEESDLECFKETTEYKFYVCPCGGTDHAALRSRIVEGYNYVFSCVLNCYINRLQWLIPPINVGPAIEKEEIKYLKLLDRLSKILPKRYKDPSKIDGKELAKLHHSEGCDPESAECILKYSFTKEVLADYTIHFNKHRENSK